MIHPLHLLVIVCLIAGRSAWAQQPQPGAAEAKLREGLRAVTLQVRTLQGERDQLAIEKTALENEKNDLAEKLDALTKQAATNQETAQKTVAALEASIAVRETENAQLSASLLKWQAAQKEAAAVAAKKESERANAAGRVIELDRQVADQQRRNIAMFKVGNEVLRRYESFVLGDAIAAREPFTGIARVKFQTLAQDFQDQLDDARVVATAVKPATSKPGVASTPAPKAGKPKPAADREPKSASR